MIKLIILACLFTSCSSLHTITSIQKVKNSKILYTESDTINNIDYSVENNDKSIFINFKTSDKLAITKIIRGGLKVYLDKEGGKGEKCYFNYPITYNNTTTIENIDKRNQDANNEYSLTREFAYLLNEANYINNGNRKILNSTKKDKDISFSIDNIDDKILTYYVEIPFTLIYDKNDSLANHDFISVGIVTNALSIPKPKRNEHNSSKQGRGTQVGEQSGPPGAGKGGGSGKGGPPGGGQSGGSRPQESIDRDERNFDKFEEPIEIWIKAKLFKE